MKRPLAFALTIVVFAVIAVCFLRPINENPDFGNVPKVAGYGCFEEITDCTGDTDLLTIDAIDWSRSTGGSIAVRTTPSGVLSFCSQPLDSTGHATGDADKRGLRGYAEKKVVNSWEYVGEVSIVTYYSAFGAVPDAGAVALGQFDDWVSRELNLHLPEYEPGTTYRITYFFRNETESGWSDELHTVSHTVSLPKRTNKRFDFISLGWSESAGSSIYPEIRVNYGDAPYFLISESYQEYRKNGRWEQEELFAGASQHLGDGPTVELMSYRLPPNHYNLWCRRVFPDSEHPPTDYRLTLVFCDNADGSGERYTLTLYLNTELLAEYK